MDKMSVNALKRGRHTQEREQTTIRLPAELKGQLQWEADRRGDSFNETVIRLIQAGWKAESHRFPVRKS